MYLLCDTTFPFFPLLPLFFLSFLFLLFFILPSSSPCLPTFLHSLLFLFLSPPPSSLSLTVLDEATSALSEDTEDLFYTTLHQLGITVMSVGHRSTLKKVINCMRQTVVLFYNVPGNFDREYKYIVFDALAICHTIILLKFTWNWF